MQSIKLLQGKIHQCVVCAPHLPLPPRPILQIDERAKILIAGQAPGKKAHDAGIAFDDASGERLREWLGVSKATFYDASKIAILPMGFCYPGKGKSGDLPPRSECALKWRKSVLASLENIELTLVIGQYAIAYHLPNEKGNLTQTVQNWQEHWPSLIPLPHPSPRNNIWLNRNRWFESELLPRLQLRVAEVLNRPK